MRARIVTSPASRGRGLDRAAHLRSSRADQDDRDRARSPPPAATAGDPRPLGGVRGRTVSVARLDRHERQPQLVRDQPHRRQQELDRPRIRLDEQRLEQRQQPAVDRLRLGHATARARGRTARASRAGAHVARDRDHARVAPTAIIGSVSESSPESSVSGVRALDRARLVEAARGLLHRHDVRDARCSFSSVSGSVFVAGAPRARCRATTGSRVRLRHGGEVLDLARAASACCSRASRASRRRGPAPRPCASARCCRRCCSCRCRRSTGTRPRRARARTPTACGARPTVHVAASPVEPETTRPSTPPSIMKSTSRAVAVEVDRAVAERRHHRDHQSFEHHPSSLRARRGHRRRASLHSPVNAVSAGPVSVTSQPARPAHGTPPTSSSPPAVRTAHRRRLPLGGRPQRRRDRAAAARQRLGLDAALVRAHRDAGRGERRDEVDVGARRRRSADRGAARQRPLRDRHPLDALDRGDEVRHAGGTRRPANARPAASTRSLAPGRATTPEVRARCRVRRGRRARAGRRPRCGSAPRRRGRAPDRARSARGSARRCRSSRPGRRRR